MKTWLVTRHPGAVDWFHANKIHYDEHLAHLDTALISAGDKVIGSLPVNLAAEVCAKGAEYWNLSLRLPADARGKELGADELVRYEASLQRFDVKILAKDFLGMIDD